MTNSTHPSLCVGQVPPSRVRVTPGDPSSYFLPTIATGGRLIIKRPLSVRYSEENFLSPLPTTEKGTDLRDALELPKLAIHRADAIFVSRDDGDFPYPRPHVMLPPPRQHQGQVDVHVRHVGAKPGVESLNGSGVWFSSSMLFSGLFEELRI